METRVKFTGLRHASELTGEEVMAIADGGTSYQMPLRLVAGFLGEDLSKPGGIINDIKSTALDNMQSIEDARREFMRLIELARAELAAGIDDAQRDASNAQQTLDQALSRIETVNQDAQLAIADARSKIDNIGSLAESHDAEIVEIANATADLGASVAAAQTQVAALTTEAEAVSDAFTALSAEFEQNRADVEQRVTAIANSTSAIIEQNDSLVARIDEAQTTIDFTQRLVTLARKTVAFQNSVVQAQTATSSAVVETNRVTAATETEAVLQEVQQYRVDFEESTAGLTREINLLASADQAFAQTSEELTARVDDNESAISITQRVVSLAGRTSAFQNAVVQAQNAVGSAALTTDRVVSVNERQALAQQVTTLSAEYQSAVSNITNELSVLADANQSFTQQVDTQLSQFQNTLSAAESEIVTLAQSDKAISQRVDTFETQVNGNISTVQQTLSSMQDPVNGLIAQAMTTVNVNGKRGFYALNAFNQEVQMVILADETVIYNPVGGAPKPAFIVRNGQIEANKALIGEANINTLNLAGQTVTIPVSGQAGGELRIPVGWFSVVSASLVSTGAPISIAASAVLRMEEGDSCVAQMRILVKGVEVWAATVATSNGEFVRFQTPATTIMRTAGAGPCGIVLQLRRSGGAAFLDVYERNITAIEVKR